MGLLKRVQASELAQQVKVLAAKPADLSSLCGTHMVEGDPTPTSCPLPSALCPCTYPSIPNNYFLKGEFSIGLSMGLRERGEYKPKSMSVGFKEP